MDFRDQIRKISDDVGKMAKGVADNSKKVSARVRIRRLIRNCKTSLQSVYSQIGLLYYTANQSNPSAEYDDLFSQVTAITAQLDMLKMELAGLDHSTICPSCGSTVDDLQKFCPGCGCRNTFYGRFQAKKDLTDAELRVVKETKQEVRKAEKEEQTTAADVLLDEDDIILPADSISDLEDE